MQPPKPAWMFSPWPYLTRFSDGTDDGPHAESRSVRMDLVKSPTGSADAAVDPTYGESASVDDETERRPGPHIAGYA